MEFCSIKDFFNFKLNNNTTLTKLCEYIIIIINYFTAQKQTIFVL